MKTGAICRPQSFAQASAVGYVNIPIQRRGLKKSKAEASSDFVEKDKSAKEVSRQGLEVNTRPNPCVSIPSSRTDDRSPHRLMMDLDGQPTPHPMPSSAIDLEASRATGLAPLPAGHPDPIIAIDRVNHYFGKGRLRKQILFEICTQIYPGEILIMTGPSGSGKTTLLTLIGALRSTQDGSLKVMGQELKGAPTNQLVHVRRYIGYIFQANNLLQSLSARQNVQMSMDLHPEVSSAVAVQRSQEMLEAVGLGEWINYYPQELSGGQKQRVAIARALVSHPKIVLADEPTAALDKKSGRDVVEIMQRLAQQQGCTILIVTHDHRILDIADRIIHMEDGRLRSLGRDSV